MKIVTIVGARPQFIKAAVLSRGIAHHTEIQEIIVHTGQHFDDMMSRVFFDEMQIPSPQYNLNINSLGHGAMTGRMIEGIEAILLKENPDFVLVYGDTNSTLAGALAAKKLHIKVVHVEAGLRSFNMAMPEEINRILTDRISDILCCPTDKSIENLDREGFRSFPCKIAKTGDVMYDAAMFYSTISSSKSRIIETMGLDGKDFVLCTIHRAENTDDVARLSSIVCALNELSSMLEIILPLHPRTAKILHNNNIKMAFAPLSPVSYFDMIELLKRTKIVITDSGGLQKESYFFKKPCIILRNETEWVELVRNGNNYLAGADTDKLLFYYRKALDTKTSNSVDLYGDGDAHKKVLSVLLEYYV